MGYIHKLTAALSLGLGKAAVVIALNATAISRVDNADVQQAQTVCGPVTPDAHVIFTVLKHMQALACGQHRVA